MCGYSTGKGRNTLHAPALLPQVQATIGALWDAYEDVAVYMEVVSVQTLVDAPRGELAMLPDTHTPMPLYESWQSGLR